jgi:hypothetical protein
MKMKSYPKTTCYSSSAQAKIALSVAVLLATSGMATGPAAAATPTPFLEDSTIVSTGGTLTATRVPVETATGSIVYQDVTIQLDATAKGGLTLAPGYPKIQPSPPILTSGFLAGHYAGPPTVASGNYLVTVTGPGIGGNGTTVWSLTAAKWANACTAPLSATWYSGPISENPLAPRIKRAGITSTDYSYGIVGVSEPSNCASNSPGYYYTFLQDALIGVTQTQDSLTIVSFEYNEGTDSSTPVAQITYTLQP